MEDQLEDSNDELKGTALQALWPDHLTPAQLFGALVPAKVPNRSGSYDLFLSTLGRELGVTMLPEGVRWARDAGGDFGMRGRLTDEIVQAAWEHLDQPEVMEPFADLVIERLSRYEPLVEHDLAGAFAAAVAARPDLRRRLVEEMVLRMGSRVEEAAFVVTHPSDTPLVRGDDVEWLLQRTAACEAEDADGSAWAALLRAIINPYGPTEFERLYAHRERPHIARVFAPFWAGIQIDGEAATQERAQYHAPEAMRARHIRSAPRRDQTPLAERVLDLLGGARKEDEPIPTNPAHADEWVRAARELSRNDDGHVEHWATIEAGCTWRLLDEVGRARVVAAADLYLRTYSPSVVEPDDGEEMTWESWAGERALRLLGSVAPDRAAALPSGTWAEWGPLLFQNGLTSGGAEARARHDALLAHAYASAPGPLQDAAHALIVRDDREKRGLWELQFMEPLWDDRFGAMLLGLLREGTLTAVSSRALLEHDVDGAQAYAEGLLAGPLPRDGERRDDAVSTAAALLLKARDGGWRTVWPLMRRSRKFGREVVLAAAPHAFDPDRFTEDQLADVFAWLTAEFPYPDPWYVGVHTPSRDDEVRRWRRDILRSLRARITPAAVTAFERLRTQFPELEWLSHAVLDAREELRRASWVAPDVADLLSLAAHSDRRLIETGDQLLDLVIDSLLRFEGELQTE
ncbi:MAG TPA: hypothetical protein VE913_07130, partial [Longimicrobium sp.]|nr:hypothetical protein [Longimicrobium sp.]